jgi:hypothetical protein
MDGQPPLPSQRLRDERYPKEAFHGTAHNLY